MSRIEANVLSAHDLGDHGVLGLHHPLGEVGPDSALHPLIGQVLGCRDLIQLAGEERELLGPSPGCHAGKLIGREVGLGDTLQEVASLLGAIAGVVCNASIDQLPESLSSCRWFWLWS